MTENQKNLKPSIELPFSLFFFTVLICVNPFILNLMGFDFGNTKVPFQIEAATGMGPTEILDSMFRSLSGSFTHTILEWSAFCMAIMIVTLSFTHFSIKHDSTTPRHRHSPVLHRLYGCLSHLGRRPVD
ncbi:MAG: hypothetical protein QGG38_02935 [Nitrospinaceae bacterium]|jgi:hypothetical protein|nr:hypothetical protein [Nitrospinaceae bacterium]|tara:strand:+ start:188 stop:574 length:387 start_codon:yes stop_codon:yes gene_type:complete